jgi:hypothetical protein
MTGWVLHSLTWLSFFFTLHKASGRKFQELGCLSFIYGTYMYFPVENNIVLYLGCLGTQHSVLLSRSIYSYVIYFYTLVGGRMALSVQGHSSKKFQFQFAFWFDWLVLQELLELMKLRFFLYSIPEFFLPYNHLVCNQGFVFIKRAVIILCRMHKVDQCLLFLPVYLWVLTIYNDFTMGAETP